VITLSPRSSIASLLIANAPLLHLEELPDAYQDLYRPPIVQTTIITLLNTAIET
jgi:hypothetical protein